MTRRTAAESRQVGDIDAVRLRAAVAGLVAAERELEDAAFAAADNGASVRAIADALDVSASTAWRRIVAGEARAIAANTTMKEGGGSR